MGETLEQIAWHKAGIMKCWIPTFIDGCQSKVRSFLRIKTIVVKVSIFQGALEVLENEALKVGSPLKKVPELASYDWNSFPKNDLGLYGQVYQRNASLALQLSRCYYDTHYLKKEPKAVNSFKLDLEEALGLKLCQWPGRSQMVSKDFKKEGDMRYFLDCAHTKLSMQSCVEWFQTVSPKSFGRLKRNQVFKALVFNITRDDRKAEPLLKLLAGCDFDACYFTPQQFQVQRICNNPTFSRNRCSENAEIWAALSPSPAHVVKSFGGALDAIKEAANKPSVEQVQVLVTGSVKLIGTAFEVIGLSTSLKPDSRAQKATTEAYKKMIK